MCDCVSVLRHNHTERQASAAVAGLHWLVCDALPDASKSTPPAPHFQASPYDIPNALNPDAYIDATLDARYGYALKDTTS